ncbi:hypothetical protein [Cerasicoccus fimbriatus]|uniref:hypothetical protein n=1 Tax=Cerasicoccus fimbriatus TaxID=3014554 RepID=UPI0022B51473|nr:hypothetical protein [Cerasicoccus sp. TK19100]
MSETTPPANANRRQRSAWFDGAVVLALLAAVNFIAARGDVGMLSLNPTPAILAPLVVGLWYGAMPGTIIGAVTAGLIILLRSVGGQDVGAVVAEHPFALISLPVLGALVGELFNALRKDQERAQAQLQHNSERLAQLGADVEHMRQVRDQLERILLKRDALTLSFDNEIRALQETPAESFPSALLQMLSRTERVYDAALYWHKDKKLQRAALLGDERLLPPELSDDDPMIATVLENAELAALPAFLRNGNNEDPGTPFLAAFPLLDSDRRVLAVLVVAGLPFISFERTTLRRIDAFCRWAAQIVEHRETVKSLAARQLSKYGNRYVVPENIFNSRLQLAQQTYRELQAPFILVLIADTTKSLQQEALENAMGGVFRAGDTITVLPGPRANLVLLAPFAGERARDAIDQRLKGVVRRNNGMDCEIIYWENTMRDHAEILREAKQKVQ